MLDFMNVNLYKTSLASDHHLLSLLTRRRH